MLKYTRAMVTFSEVPDEISLCVDISNCPHRCDGCHSPELWDDIGETLDMESLERLMKSNEGVSCLCLMGGDSDLKLLYDIADAARIFHGVKTCWYTGLDSIPEGAWSRFDYIKTGPYVKALGGLASKTTNQRFYRKTEDSVEDITYRFWKGE